MNTTDHVSKVTARTMDGLRVALAGLPAAMRVLPLEEMEIEVKTVGELRGIGALPYALDVFIPYRLEADSAVVIARSR
jgi:hypothetical protein